MLEVIGKHKAVVFLGLLWAALFGLCLLFPYSGDDWAWGSAIGLERLSRFFADYNGRYLGNLIVLALTRNVVLRSFVVSGVLALITHQLYSFAGKRRFSTLAVAAVLLMLVFYRIGAQAVVWVAGFSNYAVPALLVLVYLNASKSLLEADGNTRSESASKAVGMAVLGLCSSLIMENITLYNMAIACVLLVYGRVRKGSWPKAQAAFLAGSVLGAALMFSNGAYWGIAASGGDGIRSVVNGLSVEKLGHMVYYLIADSWAVILCMLVTMAYRAFSAFRRSPSNGPETRKLAYSRTDWFFLVVLAAMSVVSVACVFVLDSPGIVLGVGVSAVSALFVLALLLFFLARRDEPLGRKGLLVVVSIAIIVAPLFVVDPVGPRNFFPTYVLECALACCLWDCSIEGESGLLAGVLSVVLVAVLARWFVVYIPVHEADAARNEAVHAAVQAGEDHITVPRLPNDGYVHTPDPTNGTWEHRYKLFHGIPEDFDIRLERETN